MEIILDEKEKQTTHDEAKERLLNFLLIGVLNYQSRGVPGSKSLACSTGFLTGVESMGGWTP